MKTQDRQCCQVAIACVQQGIPTLVLAVGSFSSI